MLRRAQKDGVRPFSFHNTRHTWATHALQARKSPAWVTQCGRICIGRRKSNLSAVFAGQTVGLREVDDQVWLVSFLDFDLGFFDQHEGRIEPAPNPFGPQKVSTMSPE